MRKDIGFFILFKALKLPLPMPPIIVAEVLEVGGDSNTKLLAIIDA